MQPRFILLPTRGLVATGPLSAPATLRFLNSLKPGPHAPLPAGLLVLDSIHANGAKLVTLPGSGVAELRRAHPGTRIVPEVFFRTARAPRPAVQAVTRRAAAAGNAFVLSVRLESDASPLADVEVIAFTDFAQRRGAQGRTDRRGRVRLHLPAATHILERLYLFPAHSAWPKLLRNVPLGSAPVVLRPVDPAVGDARAACVDRARTADGRGVVVGVIDTGAGPHHDLAIAGGANTVYGEREDDWSDVDGHGTHVAGLVAGHGSTFRGVAPGVSLRIYRVFGAGDEDASNFAIAKAIDRAVADGCDLLNLSLGGGSVDVLTDEAIKDARARGVLCVIAAGNDGGPVAWPGRHALAVAVSALGVRGRWPRDATQADEVQRPFGRRFRGEPCFIAQFSNRGREIDLAAPGLGIVSSMPRDRYGVMDGTSMACPVATGALARRLARRRKILEMPRSPERADEIERLALNATLDLMLPQDLQGAGMPR